MDASTSENSANSVASSTLEATLRDIPPGAVDWQVLANDGSTVRDARAGVVAARLSGTDAHRMR